MRYAKIPVVWAMAIAAIGCQPRPRSVPPHEPTDALIVTQIPIDSVRAMARTFPSNLGLPIGTRISRITYPDGSAVCDVLTRDFAAAADPCVSFAGDSLLFAGRRLPGDPWNIWQTPLDAWAPVQLTRGLGDCREPFYMARSAIDPPEFRDKVRWIGFASTSPGEFGDEAGPTTSLYCMSLDSVGSREPVTWRTSFSPGREFSPTVLADGRVLFSSERSGADGGRETIGLMALNWSGTGLNPFAGLHGGSSVKSMACEVAANRSVVYVESDGNAPLNSGNLVRVRMRRPLRTREVLSSGAYLTPHALPGGGLIVSHAPDGEQYGIYRFDAERRRLGERVYDDPVWADIDPQAIVRRPEPQGRITIVVDSKATGDIQCLSVYDSDLPELRDMPPGTVKRVRVVEGARAGPRIIGEARVDHDGSFHLRLPADTPIRFQLLDKSGVSLVDMHNWVWVRRGSRRGCIGCHENRELAPPNRTTDALARPEPQVLIPLPADRRTVDFRRDVAPILRERCATCHTSEHPTGLSWTGDDRELYERVMSGTAQSVAKLVSPGASRQSALAWRVHGRKLDGSETPLLRMPPVGRVDSTVIRTITEWIDLGAQYDRSSASNGEAGP